LAFSVSNTSTFRQYKEIRALKTDIEVTFVTVIAPKRASQEF
jgi:hypothetical protein